MKTTIKGITFILALQLNSEIKQNLPQTH